MDPLIDAVLSETTNPLMSGIARFNHQLARRLGVPCQLLSEAARSRWKCPLLSGKPSAWPDPPPDARPADLFVHDWPMIGAPLARAQQYVSQARRVFAGNRQIAAAIWRHRSDVVEAHCPGLIEAAGPLPVPALRVFTFGMGHKLRLDCYHRLHTWLEATGQSYCLFVSAGLHEDVSCPDTTFLELEELFRPAVIFLGILSDRLVAHWLTTATYVAQFFPEGLRENNTTVNAALAAGAAVVTNCDSWTPPVLRAAVTDLWTASGLIPAPLEARQAAAAAMSWDALIAQLG